MKHRLSPQYYENWIKKREEYRKKYWPTKEQIERSTRINEARLKAMGYDEEIIYEE